MHRKTHAHNERSHVITHQTHKNFVSHSAPRPCYRMILGKHKEYLEENKINAFPTYDQMLEENNIDAIIKIALNAKSGEVYNIGGNSEISNIDLVNKLCSIMDRKLPKDNGSYSDLITFVNDRPGHDFRYALSTNKIKDHLDWLMHLMQRAGLIVLRMLLTILRTYER